MRPLPPVTREISAAGRTTERASSLLHTVGSFFHSVPIRTSSQAQVCRGRRRRRRVASRHPFSLPFPSLSPFLRAQKRLSFSPEPDDAVSKSGARTRERGTRERERVGDQVSSVKKKSHCTGASDRGVGR